MRLRNIPGAREAVESSPYVVQEPEKWKGKWAEAFGRRSPLHIEVGMGKGRFLMEMAGLHPEVDYIGIEMYASVLYRAVQKREEIEREIPNLLFIRMDAERLPEIFAPDEVERIYLNFSDPWPKTRHASRRLTSRRFLSRYAQILSPKGAIEFKTDNQGLFDFSLVEAPAAGWTVLAATRDLHRDERMCQGNVMTEYEEKFSAIGNPICKMVIRRGN